MMNLKFMWLVFAVTLNTTLCFGQNTVELIPKASYHSTKHTFYNSAVGISDERKQLYFGGFELNVELSKIISVNSSFEFTKFAQYTFPKFTFFGETKPSFFFVSKLSPSILIRPIKYFSLYIGPEINLFNVTNKNLANYEIINGLIGVRGYLGPLRLSVFASVSLNDNALVHSSKYQGVESYGVSIGYAIPILKRQ